MAQLALAVGGAIIGGAIGGPVGAEIGFAAGSLIGSFFAPKPKPPAPSDVRVQDSAYGRPIPWAYGTYRMSGNVIWAGTPVTHEGDSGGKGGSPPTQSTVSMSFAVAICEGPVNTLRRMWANGKLIYDISNPNDFAAISGSSQMVTGFSFYAGDEVQNPDPTMEAALGSGNVPAYRGLCYVVFRDLDLSQWGNYMPSLSFEVIATGTSTSAAQTLADFVYPTLYGSLYMAPHLTAKGGTALGYGQVYGYDGIVNIDLTAHGAQQLNILQGSWNHGGFTMPNGYSDVPGIFTWPGWVHPDGSYEDMSLIGSPDVGLFGYGMCMWRNGSDFFISSTYPGTRPIYKCDLNNHAQINVQSSLQLDWQIIGGTASYVYAASASSGALYRLSRSTLAVVTTWSMSPLGGPFPVLMTGFVVDDDTIFMGGAANIVSIFKPSQNTLTNIGVAPFAWQTMYVIDQHLIMFSTGNYNLTDVKLGYMFYGGTPDRVKLSDIVSDLYARAGLQNTQYDVTSISTIGVRGYAVTNHTNAREAMAPLMGTYFFDAVDSSGVIKTVLRGASPAMTIAYDDLGASSSVGDEINSNPVTEMVTQEVDCPRSVTFTYVNPDGDYNESTQRAFRAQTNSNKELTVYAPVVLPDDEARMRVEVTLWEAWTMRKSFRFTTPLAYLTLEPGDVVNLPGSNGQTYPIRLTRCQFDGQGSLIWEACLTQPSLYPNASYTVQGGQAVGFKHQTIDYSSNTVLSVLDVPPLRDQDTSPGLYLAACGYAPTWPGVMVEISRDGTDFSDYARVLNASTIGVVNVPLGNYSGGNTPDEINSFSVLTYGGALSGTNNAGLIAGTNAAYLGGEILFFRDVTQTAANTYTVSGLLRGRVGTEWAMGAHAAHEQFVFLDSAKLIATGISLTDMSNVLYFEPHLLNLFASTPVASQTTTPSVGRIKPLSPVQFRALKGSAASTSDISLFWIRRARVSAGWRDLTDVPLDEASEAYTLTVLNGSATVRTVVVTSATTYIYTAAQITADGFTSGNTITFNIFQHSDQGIAGYVAVTTIVR